MRPFVAIWAGVAFIMSGCAGKSEDERIREAQELFSAGQNLGSMLAYQDILKKFPESPNLAYVRIGLARCYMVDRDFENCRELLDKVIANAGGVAEEPGFAAFWMKLDSYGMEQDPKSALDAALATSDSLRMAEPARKFSFELRLAQLLIQNDKSDEGIAIFKTILNIEPSDANAVQAHLNALGNLVTIYRRNEVPEEAIQTYRDYLDKFPETEIRMQVRKNLGLLLRAEDREDEAQKQFALTMEGLKEKIENTAGIDEKTYWMIAQADMLSVSGDLQESSRMFRKVIDDFPLSAYTPQAKIYLAENLYQDGDIESALKELTEIYEGYADTPFAADAFRRAQQIRTQSSQGTATTESLTQTPDSQPTNAGAISSEASPPEPQSSTVPADALDLSTATVREADSDALENP